MQQTSGLSLRVKVIVGFHLLSFVLWFIGQSMAVVVNKVYFTPIELESDIWVMDLEW